LIVKENKSEENSGQLRFYAISFVNELESIFYQKFKKNIKDSKIKFILEEIQKARGYLKYSRRISQNDFRTFGTCDIILNIWHTIHKILKQN
jgi:hypothetical protein